MAHSAAGRASCRSSSAATTSSTECRSSAPKGYVTPASAKTLPAPGLGAEWEEARVRGIHRNAEHEREVTLTPRAVVGDEVRSRRVRNEGGDVREQARAGEELVGQRDGGRVADGHERQPRARVARDDTGQQRQVVLHDLVTDRHRGDVDHPQPGLAQQEQQEEVALLHRLVHRTRRGRESIDAHRRHDDDRLARSVLPPEPPHVGHSLLEDGKAVLARAPRRGLQGAVSGPALWLE